MIHQPPPHSVFFKKIPGLIARYKIEAGLRNKREKIHALVVEDQLFSRQLLQQVLHKHCLVETAENAKKGMNIFLETAPDIIFLDIELPDESGHMLAELIKSVEKEAFIVMVTANHSGKDVSQARKNNVDGFIAKPYNKGKIGEVLEKFWEKHPNRRPDKFICIDE